MHTYEMRLAMVHARDEDAIAADAADRGSWWDAFEARARRDAWVVIALTWLLRT